MPVHKYCLTHVLYDIALQIHIDTNNDIKIL